VKAIKFVEHIGLTDDFEKLSAYEQVGVVQNLIRYNGDGKKADSIFFHILKLTLVFFAGAQTITKKILEKNFKGEYKFPKSIEQDLREELMGFIDMSPDKNTISDYTKFIETLIFPSSMSGFNITYSTKMRKDLAGFEYNIVAVREEEVAKKNMPEIKINIPVSFLSDEIQSTFDTHVKSKIETLKGYVNNILSRINITILDN
jgi:hypothetical protein